jgi:hypothetical protein
MNASMKLINGGADDANKLVLAANACAVAVNQPGTVLPGSLEVYDGQGRLVLRYEPDKGRVNLGFSSITLTVNSTTGDTALESEGKLTLSGEEVEVLGRRSAVLGVRSALGQMGATVAAGAHRLVVLAKGIDVRAEREHRDVKQSVTNAQSVTVNTQHLRQHAAKLEMLAGTMLTRAKEAFAYVEGESRVEASRATWKVAQTLWFRSKRTFLKSDEDVNIDGEKVNLG